MKLRIAMVVALMSAALFGAAAPAHATCHPEKPSTCEIEDPIQCVAYVTLPNGTNLTIDYCNIIPQ